MLARVSSSAKMMACSWVHFDDTWVLSLIRDIQFRWWTAALLSVKCTNSLFGSEVDPKGLPRWLLSLRQGWSPSAPLDLSGAWGQRQPPIPIGGICQRAQVWPHHVNIIFISVRRGAAAVIKSIPGNWMQRVSWESLHLQKGPVCSNSQQLLL